jgi:hypothetical protein
MSEISRSPQVGAQGVVPPVGLPTEPPPEMRELAELLTELFQKASELALACIEIGEEDIKVNPALKDLRDSCLDVTRIVRKVMKLSRKVQR